MCRFKTDKITYSKHSLEQRMALAKISFHCILRNSYSENIIRKFYKKIKHTHIHTDTQNVRRKAFTGTDRDIVNDEILKRNITSVQLYIFDMSLQENLC